MKIPHSYILLCLVLATAFSRPLPAQFHAASKNKSAERVALENSRLKLTFDPNTGRFDLLDKANNRLVWKNARFAFDQLSSSDAGVRFTSTVNAQKKSITLEGHHPTKCTLLLTIEFNPTGEALLFTPALKNESNNTRMVKTIYAIADAALYQNASLTKLQVLDGNGGGEVTHVRNEPYCHSRNNLLLTALTGNQRISLTMGGLSYEFFEKFASIHSAIPREERLATEMKRHQQKLLAYVNLGAGNEEKSAQGIRFRVEQGKPYVLQTTSITEVNQIVYDAKEVIIEAAGLQASKPYSLGFSWVDEFDKRVESVYVADAANPTKRYPLLLNQALPIAQERDTAEQRVYPIPAEAYRSGTMKIYFQNATKAPNAVVSELWINAGNATKGWVAHVSAGEAKALQANLYASDPVGKRLQPGETLVCKSDQFYVDVLTTDPFTALETYALALKKTQQITLRPYTFPTVCLWYASHGGYGGEAAAVNDSKGAVEEMEKIAKSGFLRYSTAAVRLVPDSYLPSNEQGWWDDAHWQKYGSGSGAEHVEYNVKVEGGHYKPPYETTAKWANAVTKLGGIPLLYFQTGVRSQDYAEAFPGHMLFNQADREANNHWPNPNKVTYDFTDAGFLSHMQTVYANLRTSGVQGLMFDYPETGWADYGGFEDSTKTTAWAYRQIFKLAHDGLNGDASLVHERNLNRGSEITLGVVASQRVWGDTDGMTPEMMTRCGLRWYKDRVVVSYDTDSKNLAKFRKVSRDKLQQVLTMVYVTTGRFLVGNSFSLLSKDDLYDLSRVFPFHETPQSARPVDAFRSYYPSVYDYKVDESWHLLTLYNTNEGKEKSFRVPLSTPNMEGGLGLNPAKSYYAYDFWNQQFIGKLPGNSTLAQTVRTDEARMIALHEVQAHPQFISTNRHLMQGYLDLENVRWESSANALKGTAKVIGGEPFKLILATNGYQPTQAKSEDNRVKMELVPGAAPGLYELLIHAPENTSLAWQVLFK